MLRILLVTLSVLMNPSSKLDPRLQMELDQPSVQARQAVADQSVLHNVFLYFTSAQVAYTDEEIVALGGEVAARFDDMLLVRVPASALATLSEDARVLSIEGDKTISSKLTKAVQNDSVAAWMTRGKTGTASTPTKVGKLDGSGVIVGVFDGGFDVSSPAFLTEDVDQPTVDHLRVKAFWYFDEQGRSTKYSGSQLIKAYDSRSGSHATHVAAAAAGSQVEVERGKETFTWSGIAPKADLIFGAGQDKYYKSGENSWFNTILGVNQFFQYADSMKQPCVVNLSLGCNIGRHDDTHPFAKAMKALTDNKPGHVVCVASSNEGDMTCSFKDTLRSVDQQITLVYDELDEEAEFEIYNMSDSSSLEPVLYIWTQDKKTGQAVVHGKIDFKPYNKYNIPDTAYCVMYTDAGGNLGNKRLYLIRATPKHKDVRFTLALSRVDHDVEVRGYADYPADFAKVKSSSLTPTNEESISPLACNNYVLSVGSYTTYDGSYMSFVQDTLIPLRKGETYNQVTTFTSYGYDWNNVYRPDVLCPGVQIESYVSTWDSTIYNRQTEKIKNKDVTIAVGNSILGVMSGTSMSSPHMAGVVALLLQNNPKLTTADIRTYLKNSNKPLPNPTLQSKSGRLDAIALAKQAGVDLSDSPTALVQTPVSSTPIKRIVNGQLLIFRDGKTYDVTGKQL